MNIANCIHTIDSHTAGMPTRMVGADIAYIPGTTLAEKRQYIIDHMGDLVKMLIDEPRGHNAMRGGTLIPPTITEAHVMSQSLKSLLRLPLVLFLRKLLLKKARWYLDR